MKLLIVGAIVSFMAIFGYSLCKAASDADDEMEELFGQTKKGNNEER